MALWELARPPHGFTELWGQELGSLAELARLRTRLRTTLRGTSSVTRPRRELWSERLVLIADELASNALRHGTPPVAATLSRGPDGWLFAVDDSSPEVPPRPRPAEHRDPSQGGLGLYLIADLAACHGWFVHRGAKTVWAVVALTQSGADDGIPTRR